jgi:DNA-binding MarR family transcriptional regulator
VSRKRGPAGRASADRDGARRDSAGRDSAGPDGAGQTSTGQTSTGQTSAGPDSAGGAGQTSAGPDSAGQTSAGPDSAEPLSDAFFAVARQLRELSQEALAPWDITPAHLRALRAVSHHGAIRLSELSGRLHIAPRSATEVVDALEARDLVARRPDPGDRRATLVEVTEHGAGLLAAIRAARGTEAERAFSRLSETDRAHLARILGQLRA